MAFRGHGALASSFAPPPVERLSKMKIHLLHLPLATCMLPLLAVAVERELWTSPPRISSGVSSSPLSSPESRAWNGWYTCTSGPSTLYCLSYGQCLFGSTFLRDATKYIVAYSIRLRCLQCRPPLLLSVASWEKTRLKMSTYTTPMDFFFPPSMIASYV